MANGDAEIRIRQSQAGIGGEPPLTIQEMQAAAKTYEVKEKPLPPPEIVALRKRQIGAGTGEVPPLTKEEMAKLREWNEKGGA